ncbi:MAG: VWA domain-containing protein [Elusimicrobiota bacterium]|jgi:Ca-activated chloride channel family protein|nr:VWA domain-containing protein [Elusimicrobiota bacterium]
MTFADKNYLFLLLLLPILAFLFFAFYKKRKEALSKFAGEDRIEILTNADMTVWIKKYVFITAGFFFLILALARPQFGDKMQEIEQESSEIIIALDVSKSMLAQDISPNRLERAKFMLLNIIEESSGDRMGVIVFSGTAMWQCPLTYDLEALKMFLQDVSVEQLPVGGTQISDAIALAAQASEETAKNNKVLLLISDGEDHDSKINDAIKVANKNGLRIISVGIGSHAGAPIPQANGYLKDNRGAVVMTKLNPTLLKSVAEQTGGQYFEAEGRDISSALIRAVQNIEKTKNGKIQRNSKTDRFQLFLLLALLSFLAGMLIPSSIKKK